MDTTMEALLKNETKFLLSMGRMLIDHLRTYASSACAELYIMEYGERALTAIELAKGVKEADRETATRYAKIIFERVHGSS